MPIIRRSQKEPFSAKQMYELVNDVNAYPTFLPWCKGARIITATPTMMEASILTAKGPLNKWFTTRNTLVENEKITLNLVDGPFKHLRGEWKFQDLPEGGSEIHLMIDFDFSFGPARLILTPIFENIAGSMVSAFSAQAKVRYGRELA